MEYTIFVCPLPQLQNMSHITELQRCTIYTMLQNGHKVPQIATFIKKHKSNVYREIKRNCDSRNGTYRNELAQKKCEKTKKDKPHFVKFTQEQKIFVKEYLSKKYSPEQIVGYAKKIGQEMVSHETIYKYVWKDKEKKGTLYENLRNQGKIYRKRGYLKDKRGIIKDKIPMSERPEIVEKRERFGDFEIDTIIGKDHKSAMITINDRATGVLKLRRNKGKNAEELAKNTIEVLKDWKPYLHTITSDNGKEFAMHQKISKELEIDYYFARPYHSWERGSNENLNGLIRQYIPKKTDFDTLTDEYIQFVEDELNNRPRKRFNFETPNQILTKKVAFTT